MRVDQFDFELPNERIALRPARPRDAARMLVVRPGETPELSDKGVRDLPALLEPGDALVFNDTKVIPAQSQLRRLVSILLLRSLQPSRSAELRCTG